MASFKFPGPLCMTTDLSIDSGTLARTTNAPPGPLGTNPLDAMLNYLESKSPRGRAAERLRKLLQPPEGTDEQLSEAVAELLDAETEIQTQRMRDDAEVIMYHYRSRAGTKTGVKEEDLRAIWLRQPIDQDSGGRDATALVNQAWLVISQRRMAELKNLVESAQRPGSRVTDAELEKALHKVIGTERQSQLLGNTDSDDMRLVKMAMKLLYQRKLAAVKNSIENAKRPASGVTDAQLRFARNELNGIEKTKQIMTDLPDAPGDLTVHGLLSEIDGLLEQEEQEKWISRQSLD